MIKKLLVLVSLLMLLIGGLNIKTVRAEYAPKEEWIKTFGSSGDCSAYSVIQTADGGYATTGQTESYWFWLLKTDKDGNEEWNRTFGSQEDMEGVGHSIKQTTDGGFIIVGTAYYYKNVDNDNVRLTRDVWLIKTDVMGNLTWHKMFGGVPFDEGNSVQQTNDGGYIILGNTEAYASNPEGQAIWLIKTDTNGNEQWNKTFGGLDTDDGYNVQQTNDDGYIIAGRKGLTDGDIWLIKTDTNGNEQWNKTFGSWAGFSVKQTDDGGYVITGDFSTLERIYKDAIVLIKTDASGNEIWYKKIGVNSGYGDSANSVQNTADGGYIIAGETSIDSGGYDDAWLIKTDANGDMVWDRIFYNVSGCSQGENIQQTTDGGYIFVGNVHGGRVNDDICLIKIPLGEYFSDSKNYLQNNTGTVNKKTPGFELIFALFAIALALFWQRKRI